MTDLKPLIDLIQAALIPGLLYGIKLLWDIREHLARLNGRVEKCEQLREAHEEHDRQRHQYCEERIEKFEDRLMSEKR